ncbi:MAG: hypothetical protein Q9224_000680 [Gallowayella concinna]
MPMMAAPTTAETMKDRMFEGTDVDVLRHQHKGRLSKEEAEPAYRGWESHGQLDQNDVKMAKQRNRDGEQQQQDMKQQIHPGQAAYRPHTAVLTWID